MKVYINGKFYDKQNAKISVFDHGLLYGDGVFEGIRVYNRHIFRLDQHIDRLYESAKTIALKISLSRSKLIEAAEKTVKRNKIVDGYIRLVVTRGVGTLGLNPFLCRKSQIIIIADKITLYDRRLYEKGLPVRIASVVRNLNEAVSPQVKSMNYLNNILAKIEAINSGMIEAIMLNNQGYVAEATGDNIFIVKNGTLITPSKEMGILGGITRGVVIEMARARGLQAIEGVLTRHDVYNADECFLTGTAAEVIPVIEVDKRRIGSGRPGKITKTLMNDFKALIEKESTETQ